MPSELEEHATIEDIPAAALTAGEDKHAIPAVRSNSTYFFLWIAVGIIVVLRRLVVGDEIAGGHGKVVAMAWEPEERATIEDIPTAASTVREDRHAIPVVRANITTFLLLITVGIIAVLLALVVGDEIVARGWMV